MLISRDSKINLGSDPDPVYKVAYEKAQNMAITQNILIKILTLQYNKKKKKNITQGTCQGVLYTVV